MQANEPIIFSIGMDLLGDKVLLFKTMLRAECGDSIKLATYPDLPHASKGFFPNLEELVWKVTEGFDWLLGACWCRRCSHHFLDPAQECFHRNSKQAAKLFQILFSCESLVFPHPAFRLMQMNYARFRELESLVV